MNSYYLGTLLGILSTFFYAVMDSSIKFVSQSHELNFLWFYFQTVLVVTTILLVIGIYHFKTQLFKVKKPLPVMIRGITSFINLYLAFYILRYLPLDIYYSIIFTSPIISSLLAAFFLTEKFNYSKIISLGVGFIGILIISNPFNSSFNNNYFSLILLTLLLATSISIASLITRKYLSDESTIKVSFFSFFICTILSGTISIININTNPSLYFTNDLHLVFITSISCLIAFYLFLKAYQISPVQLVAPTGYFAIVWGVFFGYIIFGDVTALNTIIGCIIVILSNFIISLGSKKYVQK